MADAAVVGVPSAECGETPVASVVLAPGAASTTTATTITAAGEIRDWVNARVGKTQRLSALRCVEALPRSAIGKVLERELREGWVAVASEA